MSDHLSAQELEEICGRDAAARLLAAFGGTRVYVPAAMSDEHPLVIVMGEAAALALAAALRTGNGGMVVRLPIGSFSARARQRELLRLAVAQGGSAATIARRLGITIRTVFREKRRQRLAAAPKGPTT